MPINLTITADSASDFLYELRTAFGLLFAPVAREIGPAELGTDQGQRIVSFGEFARAEGVREAPVTVHPEPNRIRAAGEPIEPAAAMAAMGDMIAEATSSPRRRRGRPTAAEVAQRAVADAKTEAETATAADTPTEQVFGEDLASLLAVSTIAETLADDAGAVIADAGLEAAIAETAPEPTAEAAVETPAATVSAEEDDLAALLGGDTASTPVAEDYAAWDREKLFGEIKSRASDKEKPLGAGWLRKVVGLAKTGTLAGLTEDQMRAALIKNDAGLDP